MKKAVLYARVSSDTQKQERTIESQVAELRKQIAAAGDVLVKEYIDDGYSGATTARPALEQLRADLKSNLFETVYFLNTDRIARDVAYQTIIIAELLKHEKQIIINGKDYIHNPENKFTLTVLGAVAELERAKIIERMMRGKLHRLRMGQISNSGVGIFGYDYVKKTPTSPPALVINEKEAEAVRSMFEMYDSGKFGLKAIARSLEERRIPTRMGRRHWYTGHIKSILQKTAYAGVQYFNTQTKVKSEAELTVPRKHGYFTRPRAEWIAVKVPAIVSQDLFDRVQSRLQHVANRRRQPDTHYLLSGLVRCGECGRAFASYRRYLTVRRGGKDFVYHKSAYKCVWRHSESAHDRSQIQRCRNPEVSTHLLEEKVFEMIHDTMLDPKKLDASIEATTEGASYRRKARHLARIESELRSLGEQKRRMVDLHASEHVAQHVYSDAARALDKVLDGLNHEKEQLLVGMRGLEEDQSIDARITDYCNIARARIATCTDFAAKQEFLQHYIEKVIYRRYKEGV
jgi:site-specific DNA recombinase